MGVICREVLPIVVERVEEEDAVQKIWINSNLVGGRKARELGKPRWFPKEHLA